MADRDTLAAVVTLQPFWKNSLRALTLGETGPAQTLLSKALRTAVAVGDPAGALMLLRPFRVELLAEEHAGALAAAGLLLDLSWTWLAERIHAAIAGPSPSVRDQATALGEPLSAVLASAASLGATPVLDAVRPVAARRAAQAARPRADRPRGAPRHPRDHAQGPPLHPRAH